VEIVQMIKEELLEMWIGMIGYFSKSITYVSPIWVFITTVVSYLLFPHEAYIAPATGLGIALIIDVVSKYYAISVKNGGFFNSLKTKKITSDSMWRGTKKKIISVLVVMIICGLSIRFTPQFPQIAIGLSTIAYGFMFYREVQSILENFIDAGHEDLQWFLSLIKRKKKQILDEEEIGEYVEPFQESKEDSNQNNTPTI
jgi:phage-related holin